MAKLDFDAIRAEHPIVETAARYLSDIQRKGREYVAHCPFHHDGSPSLTFYPGRDGVGRFRCFPCGMGGDVIDFVAAIENVDTAEAARRLTGGDMPKPGAFKVSELPPDESDCWEPILPAPADAPPYDPAATYNPRSGKTVRWRPSRVDAVRSPQGAILGHVVRLEFEDGGKVCPVVTFCEGPGGARRWTAKKFPRPTPLIGLDDLAARPLDAVLVVSGEKCRAKAAEALPGFVVVTWIGGDDNVEHADLEPLRGRNLTLWPDADDSGRGAMGRLAGRLA